MYYYCYVYVFFFVIYALFYIYCFYRANWHSSSTLTEVFPCFTLSSKANTRI